MTPPERAGVDRALAAIDAYDATVNAFTLVVRDRPRHRPGPLAGLTFAAKNLFDIAGVTTRAGSKINREQPPATSNATAVARLEAAGAVLVGATNMDEYASGFTTENSHDGPTRNPHDPTRIAGGSSGGSAAAVAAGFADIALGTDTNGSIRVPASLCGVFGLKPTYGRLSRTGVFPLAWSLDHVGPIARSVGLLARAYDALQGPDDRDPACAQRTIEPVVPQLNLGIGGLRIARLGGYFEQNAGPETLSAVEQVARALDVRTSIEWPHIDLAAPAAAIITSAESAAVHLPNLRRRAADFDPLVRDRFLANALVPAAWVMQAQRVRQLLRERVAEVFRTCDVLIAGATPWPAQPIGTARAMLNGTERASRIAQGLLTRPFSLLGLPVIVVPIHREGQLPIGVQLIGAPWREDLLFRVAARVESLGVAKAPIASSFK